MFEKGTHVSSASVLAAVASTSLPSVAEACSGVLVTTGRTASLSSGFKRYQGLFSSNLQTTIAAAWATAVAASEVPMMTVGSFEPLVASRAMTVTGMSVIELVLIASNMHIGLVATPGR